MASSTGWNTVNTRDGRLCNGLFSVGDDGFCDRMTRNSCRESLSRPPRQNFPTRIHRPNRALHRKDAACLNRDLENSMTQADFEYIRSHFVSGDSFNRENQMARYRAEESPILACRYLLLIAVLECDNWAVTRLRGEPLSIACEAWACLIQCAETGFSIRDRLAAALTIRVIVSLRNRLPYLLRKIGASGGRPTTSGEMTDHIELGAKTTLVFPPLANREMFAPPSSRA